MPVSKTKIKKEIKKVSEEASEMEPEKAKEHFYDGMAQIIQDAIHSADVKPGISVTGSSATGGPVQAQTTNKGSLI